MKKTRRHIQINFPFIIICILCSAALFSCSSDDEPKQNDDGRKLLQLTITKVPMTRATLTDNGATLGAVWNGGDNATYFNLTTFSSFNEIDYGSLTAQDNEAESTFTGTARCAEGNKLAFLYPAKSPVTQGTDRGKFPISLAGQKGTLEDIATNFHYIYGIATVGEPSGNTVSATMSPMKSLLAVCKFIFKDSDGTPISVKTLDISYYDNSYHSTLNYPLNGTITPSTSLADVVANPETSDNWEGPLSITLGTEKSGGVYVALFPIQGPTGYMHFSVTSDSNVTYTGTAHAKLNAGYFYSVTLTLNKATVN